MKVLVATDAWHPQVNGVVRTLGSLARASNKLGVTVEFLSPDGFPIYAQSQRYPGAFAATCHSGVTLAGAHTLDLAPQIAAGELNAHMQSFAPERFAQGESCVSH